MLEESWQNVGSVLGVVRHPADHRLVDLPLRGDQELVAGDEAGYLVPRERAEVFTLDRHLQLRDEFWSIARSLLPVQNAEV